MIRQKLLNASPWKIYFALQFCTSGCKKASLQPDVVAKKRIFSYRNKNTKARILTIATDTFMKAWDKNCVSKGSVTFCLGQRSHEERF